MLGRVLGHPRAAPSCQKDHDDAHHLGGIVGPVAERHPTRRQDLHPLVELVGSRDVHAHLREEEPAQPHDAVPGQYPQKRREKEGRENEAHLVPGNPVRTQRSQP